MELNITNGTTVRLRINNQSLPFRDEPLWLVSTGEAKIETEEKGMSCLVMAADNSTAVIRVTATVDKGNGNEFVAEQVTINMVESALSLVVEAA
jgi:hypothetical protein